MLHVIGQINNLCLRFSWAKGGEDVLPLDPTLYSAEPTQVLLSASRQREWR